MDKFEYELKVEQIEKLVGREDYSTAKKIADTMEWKKEKDPKLLSHVAELYVQAGDINKAMTIYNYAYNASTRGLLILERMTELAITYGQLELAQELCDEYRVQGAYEPDVNMFRFQISEARGEDYEKRIPYLEKYCKGVLDEDAIYKLAWLYDKVGRKDECIRLCNYLIDFFCFGQNVDNAIKLKTAYEPLNKYQEEKITDSKAYEENYNRYIGKALLDVKKEKEEKRAEERIRQEAVMEEHENDLGRQISEIVKEQEEKKDEISLEGLVAEEELMAEISLETETAAEEAVPEETVSEEAAPKEPEGLVEEAVPQDFETTEEFEGEAEDETSEEIEDEASGETSEESECVAPEDITKEYEEVASGNVTEEYEEVASGNVTEEYEEVASGEALEEYEEVASEEASEEDEEITSDEPEEVVLADFVNETISEYEPEKQAESQETILEEAIEMPEEILNSDDLIEVAGEEGASEEEPDYLEEEPLEKPQRVKSHRDLSALELMVPEGSFKVACSDAALGEKYALELVRMVPEDDRCEHIAKITAKRLNKAKFSYIEEQLDNDILMVTGAGQLSNGVLDNLYAWMKKSLDNKLIFVDNPETLRELEERRPKLMKRFSGSYEYEKKEISEWMELVNSYADENDCVLSEDASRLFEEYLNDKEAADDVVLGINLKEAIQDAMHEATRVSVGNLLSAALSTKYDEDGLLILRDRHFQ